MVDRRAEQAEDVTALVQLAGAMDDRDKLAIASLREAGFMELAYLHVIRLPGGRVDNIALAQRYFSNRLIGNDSYTLEEAGRVDRTIGDRNRRALTVRGESGGNDKVGQRRGRKQE